MVYVLWNKAQNLRTMAPLGAVRRITGFFPPDSIVKGGLLLLENLSKLMRNLSKSQVSHCLERPFFRTFAGALHKYQSDLLGGHCGSEFSTFSKYFLTSPKARKDERWTNWIDDIFLCVCLRVSLLYILEGLFIFLWYNKLLNLSDKEVDSCKVQNMELNKRWQPKSAKGSWRENFLVVD